MTIATITPAITLAAELVNHHRDTATLADATRKRHDQEVIKLFH